MKREAGPDAPPDVPRSDRVVTLIASATEIVAALGMAHRLVGISHECDHPPEVLGLPRLSSPKIDPTLSSARIDRDVRAIVRDGLSVYRVDLDALSGLRPDVIVTQDHCEVCAVSLQDVERALCGVDLPDARVCSLHPQRLEDVREDFRRVARALDVPARGDALVAAFDARLQALTERTASASRPRVALLEWIAPPMVAGGWMPELARIAGAQPVIVETPDRFSTVDWDDVAAADPDVVLVLPCGLDVPRSLRELADAEVAHGLRSIRATREGRCFVVDGNAYFNRPGPRLADSAEILAAVVHPEIFPEHVERYRDVIARWD